MRIRRIGAAAVLAVLAAAGLAGCSPDARPKRSMMAPATGELLKPGMFGDNAPADRRRGYFDFWNEQIVRENVAVGTVFVGDSITELWELGAYFVPADGLIVNRGISGDLASCMARRFAADVVQLRPRNVVLLAGTNDVARMQEKKVPDEEIIRSVTESAGAMIGAARQAGIHVLVCSILPTNGDTRGHEGKRRVLPRINAILKELAARDGCVYVDYGAALADGQGDLRRDCARDGLHPHAAGYRIMSDVLIRTARARGVRL